MGAQYEMSGAQNACKGGLHSVHAISQADIPLVALSSFGRIFFCCALSSPSPFSVAPRNFHGWCHPDSMVINFSMHWLVLQQHVFSKAVLSVTASSRPGLAWLNAGGGGIAECVHPFQNPLWMLELHG